MLPEAERVLLPASYRSELHSDVGEVECDIVVPRGAALVPVVENRLLTPLDYDRDTRHYAFDTAGMDYEVGDSLGIYPHNDGGKVSAFCEWYGLNEHAVLRLEDTLSDRNEPLPSNLTVQQLFGQVLDVFGRPKRRFYELLSLVATDAAEQAVLEGLSKGGDEYAANVAETVSHADLLRRFRSARPSVEHLMDYIPRIKPRLYSIASSAAESPDSIALCIVVDDWTTPSGEYKRGLASNYLTHKTPMGGDHVVAKVCAMINGQCAMMENI